MDALRCPPGDTPVAGPLRRREAAGGPLPAAAAEARHPAARRADQPSRRRERRLARAAPAALCRARSSPSPMTAISSTTSPAGFSNSTGARGFPGRGTTPPGWSRSRSGCAARRRPRAPGRRPWSGSWSGSACPPRGATPRARPASTPTKSSSAQENEKSASDLELYIPPGPRLGDRGHRGATASSKAYGDRLLFEDLAFRLPPGGIVGVIGPNGAGKTTLFRMITGQEAARRRHLPGRRDGASWPMSTRAASSIPNKTIWEEITGGQEQIQLGKQLVNSRAYVARFNFSGARPAEEGRACSPAASATACIWPRCSRRGPTSSSSTSRPTTSTSTPCAPWKRRWRTSAAAPWSSATTAGFSTASPPTSSPSRGRARWSGSRGTTPKYEEDRKKRLGAEADRPHRIKYRQLTR